MLIIILVVVGVLLLAGVVMYNGLVRTNVRVDEAWSDITVQLKRRADLIPNLIETVKAYAKHEKEVFENVTKARSAILGAQGVQETAEADNMFTGALKSLFAVAENYPDLKANQNFAQLQTDLTDTEDKIQAARRFYNGSARDLNIKIQTFPSSVIAGMLHFKKREFFELEEAENKAVQSAPEVKF
ncbi:MAG TPA: LemA family protein [Candidatus Saccharibacteria bacterium]|nr:LemA family protein [Candidatus Saccharibacteria bacterium]